MSEESINKKCPTFLIEDIPADADQLAFGGETGPHERVAQAMAELIQSDEHGGKMIGLEGGWGIGKTTVVNLMKKHLVGKSDISVFSFDAWAHEGDPLRRTYLESLIHHFQAEKWVDKEKWDKVIEDITHRRRITNTRTVPKTTKLGTHFALSTLLIPVGIGFMTTASRTGIELWGNPSQLSGAFILGLLIVSAPLLVLGRHWLQLRKQSMGRNINEEDTESAENDDWALLKGTAITETKQETTETPDPTSIEFECIFERLMNEALNEDSRCRAVIILDNLDRVDPKDALSIWSTLQTFLQDKRTQQKTWFRKLWIIVPYDPSGLRKLWANRNSDSVYHKQDDSQQIVPSSFIDKSFQLRFEVPFPVLSNWKEYLEKLVGKALPEHPTKDHHSIYLVFNACRKDDEAPTPRQLKLYVNQIGAIHRQWQDEFPLEHVAYYVMLRWKLLDIRKGLLGLDNVELHCQKEIEEIRSEGLKKNLAGLVFNVKADIGMQLLLSDQIENALLNNNADILKSFQTNHQDGFWTVLEQVVPSMLFSPDVRIITSIASCLDQLDLLVYEDRSEINIIMEKLEQRAATLTRWEPFDKKIADGVSSIFRLMPRHDVSRKILLNIRAAIESPEATEDLLTYSEKAMQSLIIIFEQLYKLGLQGALTDIRYVLPLDASGWIKICVNVSIIDKKWWPLIEPREKFDKISQRLCDIVNIGDFSTAHLIALSVTQELLSGCNWDSLSVMLEQRLDTVNNLASKETLLLLKALSQLRKCNCGNAHDVSKRLAVNGHILHHLYKSHAEGNSECQVWCAVTFLEQDPNAAIPAATIGNSAAGYDVLISMLDTDDNSCAKLTIEILMSNNNLSLLTKLLEIKRPPLIIRCLRMVADGGHPEILFTSIMIISNWRQYEDIMNEAESPGRFKTLIQHLCENAFLAEDVQNTESGFKHTDAGLYITIGQVSSSASFGEWCRNGLEHIDTETWTSALINGNDVLKLMIMLINHKIKIELKQQFQDARIASN